jgi:hypothetical protein
MICLLGASATLVATRAEAIELVTRDDGTRFAFTGYAQPYFRWVDNPCSARLTDADTVDCNRTTVPDGFGLQNARLVFEGDWETRGRMNLEIATVPNVELVEVEFAFEPVSNLLLRVGRIRVPFARQALTSESKMQFVGRTDSLKYTPGRQLGAAIRYEPTIGGSPWFGLDLGVFNGESSEERAPINNIDEQFLVAARVRVSPLGERVPLSEGDLRAPGERSRLLLELGATTSYESRGENNGNYEDRRTSADVAALYRGASLYAQAVLVDRDFRADDVDPDFTATGFSVQVGYFAPLPWVERHLELAGRYEVFDPSAATDASRDADLRAPQAGSGPARPEGSQARSILTGGVNLYLQGHDLKLQLNYIHREELEDWVGSAQSPGLLKRSVDDDAAFAQMTWRM